MKNNRIISLQDIIADIKDEEYIKEKILGAKQLSYIEMYIDDEASTKLVKKYYGKN